MLGQEFSPKCSKFSAVLVRIAYRFAAFQVKVFDIIAGGEMGV